MKKVLLIIMIVWCQGLQGQSIDRVSIVVNNVCGYQGQYVVSNSPASSNAAAVLGNGDCVLNSSYSFFDSLHVEGKVKFLEVTEGSPNPDHRSIFYLADDKKILAYNSVFISSYCVPVITPRDTMLTDSIAGIHAYVNQLLVYRKTMNTDNLLVFDTLSNSPVATMNIGILPMVMDFSGGIAIVGTDNSGNLRLRTYSTLTLAMTNDTILDVSASNPISVLNIGFQQVVVVSQPGDSIINMTMVNFQAGTITTNTIYNGSGAHAFEWADNFFHFQPETDPAGTGMDSMVIRHDPMSNQQIGIYNTGKRFHKLINAGTGSWTFGYFPYVHGVVEDSLNNQVLIYSSDTYSLLDSFQTASQVDFIESDFRCPVSLQEYDDSKVKIVAFPNPAGNSINVNASGLICGRDYKMDLVDNNGKIVFRKTIHAKMHVEIPLDRLSPGLYILRIHTLKGPVTEKIIKE